MSEPKVTLAEIEDWANRSGITMPGMADTMLRAVYDEVKRLHAENERLTKVVALTNGVSDKVIEHLVDYELMRNALIDAFRETGLCYFCRNHREHAVGCPISTSTPSGTEGK